MYEGSSNQWKIVEDLFLAIHEIKSQQKFVVYTNTNDRKGMKSFDASNYASTLCTRAATTI